MRDALILIAGVISGVTLVAWGCGCPVGTHYPPVEEGTYELDSEAAAMIHSFYSDVDVNDWVDPGYRLVIEGERVVETYVEGGTTYRAEYVITDRFDYGGGADNIHSPSGP